MVNRRTVFLFLFAIYHLPFTIFDLRFTAFGFLMGMRMRFYVSLTAVLGLTFFLLTGCQTKGGSEAQEGVGPPSSAGAAATPADGVRRVTVAELRAALDKGEALVVDVRGSVEYDLGHIKGARSIPLGLIAAQAKELPRDKLIVTYCA